MKKYKQTPQIDFCIGEEVAVLDWGGITGNVIGVTIDKCNRLLYEVESHVVCGCTNYRCGRFGKQCLQKVE